MMQHRNMFNYQRFSILIGTNKFLTKNSFSMYKCKPLFFSFLLILFVQPFFIQILYISKRTRDLRKNVKMNRKMADNACGTMPDVI